MTDTDDPGTPVSWLATPYRGPVLDIDGTVIGTAESLIGDENEDIFHGLAIKPEGPVEGGSYRELPAARITRITTTKIHTDLSAEEAQGLEPYREARYEHIEWGGLFRKHPHWKEEGTETHLFGGGKDY